MSWLFLDERKFFEEFTAIATRLVTVATQLEQALDDPARLPDCVATIERVQHEADEAARDLDIHIDSLFIPPLDWEDIHLLSAQLALVADFIAGTARRAVSLRATTRREHAVALAHTIVTATGAIEGRCVKSGGAMKCLRGARRSSSRGGGRRNLGGGADGTVRGTSGSCGCDPMEGALRSARGRSTRP